MTSDLALAATVDATDHTRGGGAGPQLVVYGDFECPYTAAAMQSIGALVESGAAFQLVFRHFPLRGIHPHAEAAAGSSEAAARQGRFWEMHDVLFRNQRHLEPADVLRYAERLGLDLARFESESIRRWRLESNGTWRAVSAAGWMGRRACSSMAFATADLAIQAAWEAP
jgi:protein-disulfide isomerase